MIPIRIRNLPAVSSSSCGTTWISLWSCSRVPRRITAVTETATTIQGGCVRATGPMTYASKFETGIIKLVEFGPGGALRR